MELAKQFVEDNSSQTCKMFYLWGHSYESDNNNNWEVIEKFAEYIGNRGDIWYATNIEIYNYAKAYESLITSYDRKIIYNPSAIDIWVFVDGKTLLVKSGKTFYQTKIIDVKNS